MIPKTSGRGEIGRRAGFRFLWVTPCGFESLRPHHAQSTPLWGALFAWADEGKDEETTGSREATKLPTLSEGPPKGGIGDTQSPHHAQSTPLWGALFAWADEGKDEETTGSREEKTKLSTLPCRGSARRKRQIPFVRTNETLVK